MLEPIEVFREEAREHLAALEGALLELESTPDSQELVDLCFRAMHTIKGSGGMVGFNELSQFTHHLESALDKVRAGAFAISSPLISIFLDAKDLIEEFLKQPRPSDELLINSEALVERLYAIVPEEHQASQMAKGGTVFFEPDATELSVFRIRFTPHDNSLREGFDVKPILTELKSLGDCHITTITDRLGDFSHINAELCYLSFSVTLVGMVTLEAVADCFIFVADDWAIDIAPIDLADTSPESDRIGELLVERGLLSSSQLEDILRHQTPLGQQLQGQGLVEKGQLEAALAEQRLTREAKKQVHQDGQESTVRVPTKRLDKLMNLVGELVIVQARMNQIAHLRDDEAILSIAEELEFLTTEMRDSTFSIRMLPIGTTFGRFRRLVRDLSQELGKKINLKTTGADTELDKMMIDKLGDPLVHLIRNSIDHGIEAPQARLNAGKTAQGNILLEAEHTDSQVIIRIQDDGRGLNCDAIKAKAIERGLLLPEAEPSDEEIHQLIFEPGFSTAETVSDISGRGVGMDVVKRSITELGGKLHIHSVPEQGTTLTISLPMTLAIIEGLLVRVAEEHYVLPLNIVEECIEQNTTLLQTNNRKRLVRVRDELVPFMRLREFFAVAGSPPAIEQVVITSIADEHFGFCVDEVVGQYQTVIKRLGKMYENTEGLSGATILGDGSVAMILDATALRDALAVENNALSRAS